MTISATNTCSTRAVTARGGVYFYDFTSGGFFYTSVEFAFPYLYDFSLDSVVYYYPDPDPRPRRALQHGRRAVFLRVQDGQDHLEVTRRALTGPRSAHAAGESAREFLRLRVTLP